MLAHFPDAFLPLFIAIDAVGIVPLFMSLTAGATLAQRHRFARQAVLTALAVALVVVFTGNALFTALGIDLNDVRVSGGILLLIIAITDLLFGEKTQRRVSDDEVEDPAHVSPVEAVGIVPLGIPLTLGPAAITTLLISQESYGYPVTLLSLIVNLGIVFVAFWYGPWLLDKMGEAASKVLAKVVNLFLAAIAVAMIRAGIAGMISSYLALTP